LAGGTDGLLGSISAGNFASGMVDKITGNITDRINSTVGNVTGALDNAFNNITGIFNKISSFSLSSLTSQLQSRAQQMFKSVESSYTKMTSGVPNNLSGSPYNDNVPESLKKAQQKEQADAVIEAAQREFSNAQQEYFYNPNDKNATALQNAKNKLDAITQQQALSADALLNHVENTAFNLANRVINGNPAVVKFTSAIGAAYETLSNPTALLDKVSGNIVAGVNGLANGVFNRVDAFANNLTSALNTLGGIGNRARGAISALETINNTTIVANSGTAIHTSDPRIPMAKSITNTTVPYTVQPDDKLKQQVELTKKIAALQAEMDQIDNAPPAAGVWNYIGSDSAYERAKKSNAIYKELQAARTEYQRLTGG
jgi:hypothetical protein